MTVCMYLSLSIAMAFDKVIGGFGLFPLKHPSMALIHTSKISVFVTYNKQFTINSYGAKFVAYDGLHLISELQVGPVENLLN